jgi:Fe2+ transport system protein B
MKTNRRPAKECATCPIHNVANLVKLGVDMQDADFVVALAGNPNTGKSTVFNALTGLRQHTGNWPGKTVTRAEGAFSYRDKKYMLVDLPGTYSLLSTSTDEETARNFILFGQPDVTVVVVDATRLERNLNLALQVLEITSRAVICLNLVDEATRHGIEVDERLLAKELGVPVVRAAARQSVGIPELLQNIHDVATGVIVCRPRRLKGHTKPLQKAIDELSSRLEESFAAIPNARWLALRLLEGDEQIIKALLTRSLPSLAPAQKRPASPKNRAAS